MRLFLNNTEIRDEGKQVQELKIDESTPLYIKKRNAEPLKKEEIEEGVYEDLPSEALVFEGLSAVFSSFGLRGQIPVRKPAVDVKKHLYFISEKILGKFTEFYCFCCFCK